MSGTAGNNPLHELINLWNYSLSKGATDLFSIDAPYVYLEVGRVAVERLASHGVFLERETPVETINAVFAYFVDHGFFDEARAERVGGGGGDALEGLYEIYERGCIVFESNRWAFGSGECASPACFCYNVMRYILFSAFGLDMELEDFSADEVNNVTRLKIALKRVPDQRSPLSLLEDLRTGSMELKSVLDVYRRTVNASLDAIISADERGLITIWNRAAEKAFGYKREEAVGSPLDIIVPEKYRVRHREGFKRFQATGTGPLIGKVTEVDGQRKDGTVFPAELSLSAEKAGGRWVFTAVIRDITVRRRAEEALRESELRYMELFESVKDIVYSVDCDGIITSVNPAVKMLGYERDGVLGRHFVDFIAQRWRGRTTEDFEEIKREGLKVGETVLLGADGREHYVEYSSIAVRETGGRTGIRGILRDISARKKLELELTEKLDYVERLNKLMVGRELKMEELRREIRKLRERLDEEKG
jgi:PAS domain S-box-containing protein